MAHHQAGAASPCLEAPQLGAAVAAGVAPLGAADPAAAAVADPLKPWRTLQAECLLAGHRATLIEGDDGRPLLIVTRWAMTKAIDDVSEGRAWLSRVTGAKP